MFQISKTTILFIKRKEKDTKILLFENKNMVNNKSLILFLLLSTISTNTFAEIMAQDNQRTETENFSNDNLFESKGFN
jgi:hypothetical protein